MLANEHHRDKRNLPDMQQPDIRKYLCAVVIKSFGKRIGADGKQVQGLVRLAKQNGEKLGFLA